MKLLLDTQAFVWWSQGHPGLSNDAVRAIVLSDPEFISVATAWEIAIKVGTGKWQEAKPLIDDFEELVATQGFELLPLSVVDVRRAGLMTSNHRDPFDRALSAQALNNDLTLVTSDRAMASLGARTMW